MTGLSQYLEPARPLTEFATLDDALPTLSAGLPVWMARAERWGGLVPERAVGHSRLRRIVDLPLIEVPPIDVRTDPSSAVDCPHAGGYVPVTEDGHLVGQVHLQRIRSDVPLMRADVTMQIAHDLSNTLQALSGLVEDEDLDAPFAHAARLLGRLKAAAGQTGGAPTSLDVGEIVREEISWLTKVVAPATLTVHVEGSELWGVAEPASLERILLNLVMNARDAGGDRSEIAVSVHPEGARIVVDVVDRGPGIPETLRARVFEAGTSDKGLGRGIGLASAQGVALRMGAQLRLVTTGPTGTQFRLELRRTRSRPVPARRWPGA